MDGSEMQERQMQESECRDHAVSGSGSEEDNRLDQLFLAWREAWPDPAPSANFMPEMWAKIEAREASVTVFSRFAKAIVTAALGASVLMALLSSSPTQPVSAYEGSYIQALAADRVSDLEPLQVERISDLEQ